MSEVKLEKRYESWPTVPGARSYLMYVPTCISTLEMRRVSFDVISVTHGNQAKKIIGASLIVYLEVILHAFMMMVHWKCD